MSILNLNGFYTRPPNEAKCHICKRIFCCGKCRQKHEFANHAIAVSEPLNNDDMSNPQDQAPTRTIYVFCPICERKPLMLRDEAIYSELLEHIENEHLPLRCRKCLKTYTKIEDLREFSKCVDIEQNCSTSSCSTEDASKVTVTTVKKAASSTISTQTSPAMTPISLINLHWKAKSRQQQHQPPTLQEEFMCGGDSVSSIRNLSSFSSSNFSLRRSIGQFTNPYSNPPETAKKGKVIRSTSTPLQVDYSMIPKTKETVTFNASSLYHEELPSPAVLESNPMQQQHRAWKGGVGSTAVGRNKITAVTPLRQVMSKSIQKAFVEHGGIMTAASSTALVPPPGSRLRFDLSDNNNSASTSPALDLRLSPAMRRTQSEATSSTTAARSSTINDPSTASSVMRQQILMSAQKLTTESIIITRNSHDGGNGCSTVYNSCESVEIIQTTSQTAEVHHHHHHQQHHPHPPITPITRVPGAMINKKLIKFETPQKHSKDLHSDDIDEPINRSSKEIFYTPNPDTPNDKSDSSTRRPNIIPRQLSGQFSPRKLPALEPPPLDRPRRRPPLRECQAFKSFSDISVAAITHGETNDDDEEVFLPTNASTRNDRTSSDQGIGRLWSLMSTVMRLPATREKGDKENQNPNPPPAAGSLLRRCASIAGSFVRSRAAAGEYDKKRDDDDDGGDMQTLKRKRTQTLDSHQYGSTSTSTSPLSPLPGTSSKRYRIQPRRPIERMRHPT